MPTAEVSPLAIYQKALQRGMNFVTFTDHDTMDAYDEIGWSREHLVTGVEVKLLDPVHIGHTLHINVYTLSRDQFREIQDICGKAGRIDLLIDYLNTENLPYAYNHPFWAEAGERLNIQSVFDIAPMFPVLEYNMGRVAELNSRTVRLARALGKGLTTNTDTHSGHVAEAFNEAPGKTFREFFDNLSRGESVLHHADMTEKSFTWELRHRIRNLFDRHGWVFEKPDLHIDTGIERLNRLIRLVCSQGRSPNTPLLHFLGKFLDMIAVSGFPARLFIRSQRQLGQGIDLWLSGQAG